MRTLICSLLMFILILTSCKHKEIELTPGLWRGVFILPGNEIPFQFLVKGTKPDSTRVFLVNGSDRFELNPAQFQKDSVFIPIDLYDAVLKGKLKDNKLEGRLYKIINGSQDSGIPFNAVAGDLPRFPESLVTPDFSLNGTWNIAISAGDKANNTVGNFEQNGSLLTGSILTTTGDYRFLEGVVRGKEFFLSAFGGSTPYLIKGEFANDSVFSGEFITPRRSSKLEGKRNPKAALPDPYAASKIKEGLTAIQFKFPNINGKEVSLSDPIYQGKVVIVTILGSWCPNCLDENAFLSDWYRNNHSRGVEIIGLGFERKSDFESASKSLSNLKKRLNIPYEILIAGKSTTESASAALPALSGISAFPTTIFIDRKGNVRKVHTGFNGPATGKFYTEFKQEFEQLVDSLLAE